MGSKLSDDEIIDQFQAYSYGWHDENSFTDSAQTGINTQIVKAISAAKNEPKWMLEIRLRALEEFFNQPMPGWGADLSEFDYNSFKYFVRATDKQAQNWEDLPPEILDTYEKLGVPQSERDALISGVAAQYESEVVYQSIQKELEEKGVIFTDTDSAVQNYPELLQKYFGTVIPYDDNKFSALNTACWSGGSFVYIPKGVQVDIPLQAYFRLNTANMGQFERTLIIADEGSYVHYIEGCTAPIYNTDSLHTGVVEIRVEKGARVRYTTIQNWSNNVYNLVTQRALVQKDGTMEWVDGNIGSKTTMKYPTCILAGENARGETLSLSFAAGVQQQDTGAKMIHLAPRTHSSIISKSVSREGGRTTYRGLVKMVKGAQGSSANIICDALLTDNISRTDTYPHNDISEEDISLGHEATVSKIGEEQLFYLMSRGMSEQEAMAMVVRGFIEPIAKELPMEYALELNRLIDLQMTNSVG